MTPKKHVMGYVHPMFFIHYSGCRVSNFKIKGCASAKLVTYTGKPDNAKIALILTPEPEIGSNGTF
jgi:hypothetical protein